MKRNISIPVRCEFQEFEDDRFRKAKVYVMHDGQNYNGSIFQMNSIESAKDSIANIPILAFIKQQDGMDGSDFAGHESEVVIDGSDVKYRYLGRPIGVVPAIGNDYHYETIADKTYVVVNAYIWTDYANEALDILENDGYSKSQSMEIRVDGGMYDECDNLNITQYRYTGLTILGDNVLPAMEGANIQLFSKDKHEFSDEYFSMVSELGKSLKEYTEKTESEVQDVEDVKSVTEETVEEKIEETIESTEEKVEEVIEEVFEETVEEEVAEEDVVEEEVIEEVAEEEDSQRIIFNLNKELADLKSKFQTLEEEVVGLREYKQDNETTITREEKESMFQKFSVGLTEDEMNPIKEKMDELSVNEIEMKLNKIFTKKHLELNNKKFSNKKSDVVIEMPKKETSKSKYCV